MDLLHATAELASRVDRLRPGVLDGPPPYPSIARRVAAEPVGDPAALVVTAGRLRAQGVQQLLDLAEGFDYRVPELHSGEPRVDGGRPVPYPAACRPQAWSAAAAVVCAEALR